MTSKSETGHAKNIANLEDLISFCTAYGATYNPSKPSLTIPALETLYQNAQNDLNGVKVQKTAFDNATNSRRNTFAPLKPLATKIINSFAVSGATNLAVADAKSINKKLQGTSKKKEVTPSLENPVTTTSISTSQQSYDRLIDHFANLIQVLEQNREYSPNESELQLTSLQSKLSDLQAANTNLINAYTSYSNALIARNQRLYNPMTGLIQTAKEVKQYVKSVFGATSPQYLQVSGLEFKTRRGE